METGDTIDAADADGTNDAAFAERASGASMDTAGSGIAADADRSSDAVTETGGSGIAFMHMGTPRNAATQTGAVSDVVTRMGAEIDVATKRGVPSNTATQRGAPRNAEIVTGCKIYAAVEGTIDAAVQAGDKDALKEIDENDDAREGDDYVGGLPVRCWPSECVMDLSSRLCKDYDCCVHSCGGGRVGHVGAEELLGQ